MDKLKKFGIVGAIIGGLLCFSPAIVFLLGIFGLGAFAGYAEFFTIPILLISIGLIIYAIYKQRWQGTRS